MKRVCKKCGIEKDIELFKVNKSCRYGYTHMCKECYIKITSIYNKKNKAYKSEWGKKYRKKNLRKLLLLSAAWRSKNHIRSLIYGQLNSLIEIESKKIYSKNYRNNNKNKIKILRDTNKDRQSAYNKCVLKELPDSYIINDMCRGNNIKREDIRQHPELIEAKRIQIKIKRQLKN